MKNKTLHTKRVMLVFFINGFLSTILRGQPAPIAYYKQTYFINSGVYEGYIGASNGTISVFQEVIRIPNASWLRVYFGECNLGSNSYIKVTSLKDGAQQHLNSTGLKQWHNTSAFFNGDALEVELHVTPEDKGIFFEIHELMVGECVDEGDLGSGDKTESGCPGNAGFEFGIKSICDDNDDRIPSDDPAVGRIVPGSGCTGWITSNGAHLTAGHCVVYFDANEVLQFNVPLSGSSGTINHPDPEDQYSIVHGSIEYISGGLGNDWAVFSCNVNTETGLLPVQAQEGFYRMSRDINPDIIRITGFGVDGPPPYFGKYGDKDSLNQTQQTDTGPSLGEVINSSSNAYWKYRVDTQPGNSGSPVIDESTTLSVGIHTNGGCSSTGGYNKGTSFENDALENAIQTFPGANVEYVDNGHTITTEDGTVFRPYDTVTEGVSAVSAGGIVSIVKGSYNESLTINKAVRITAPVGTVTIGPSTLSRSIFAYQKTNKNTTANNLLDETIPTKYSLSQNYPNPFNPTTTINYALKEDTKVSFIIYNMLGQKVRTLVDENQSTGYKSVVWDGKNNMGLSVTNGIYIYRIVAGKFNKTRKVVLLK